CICAPDRILLLFHPSLRLRLCHPHHLLRLCHPDHLLRLCHPDHLLRLCHPDRLLRLCHLDHLLRLCHPDRLLRHYPVHQRQLTLFQLACHPCYHTLKPYCHHLFVQLHGSYHHSSLNPSVP